MKKTIFNLNTLKVVAPALVLTFQTGFAQNPVQTTSGATTSGYIPVFNSGNVNPTTIKNSQILDNGSYVSFGNTTPPAGGVIIGGTAPIGGENFSIQKTYNGATCMRIYNNSNPTLFNTSSVNYIATANGSGIAMSAYPTNYGASGIFESGSSVLNGSGNTMNIGTTGSTPLSFWTNNTKKVTLLTNGNMTVLGGGSNTGVTMGRADGASLNYGTSYLGLNAQRDPATGNWTRYSDGANTGGSVIFGDVSGSINFSPMPTGGGSSNVTFTDANVLANQTLRIRWNTALTGTYKGQVLIGQKTQDNLTGNHNGALLQVNGDVVVGATGAANLWVTQSNWADFVFDKNYKLMPLNELEIFYKANHHLPNVPTTTDIKENGNNLGQTDAVLLQKIEENTLYIVELKKQLEEQKKLIEELAKKVGQN